MSQCCQAGMTSPWVYDAEEYYWAEPSFVVHRKGQKGACSRFTPQGYPELEQIQI